MTDIKAKKFEAGNGAAVYALGIAILMALQIIASVIILGVGNLGLSDGTLTTITLFCTLSFQAGYLGVYLVYTRVKKIKPAYGLKTDISPLSYVAGIVLAIACLFFFYAIAAAFDVLLRHAGFGGSGDPFASGGIFQNMLIVFATVIAAPVCEELIYRSGLLSGLKKRFSNITSAVLCGLAFSFMHMNPQQTVYQFFLGFTASLLVLASGSVIPAMILHAANNLIAVTGEFFPKFNGVFTWYERVFLGSAGQAAVSCIVLTALGVFAIIFSCLFLKKFERFYAQRKGKLIIPEEQMITVLPYGGKKPAGAVFYILLAAGFFSCVLMWLLNFFVGLS